MTAAETQKKRTSPGTPMKWLKAHLDYSGPECLTWPFARMQNGYGGIMFDGRMRHASRIMCMLKHGESKNPSDHAAHICGKGHLGCVHPLHIQWATPLENAHHRALHGTILAGERNPCAQLSEADVLSIRTLKGKVSVHDLADQYKVSKSNIYAIWAGETWAHLDGSKSQPPLPEQRGISGLRGVAWHKASKKWAARASVNGERKHIGLFETPEQAAKARREFLQRSQE